MILYEQRICLSQMMEDFSGLALPPLFGGHILEAELEPGGVELGPGEVMLMYWSWARCPVLPVLQSHENNEYAVHRCLHIYCTVCSSIYDC